MRPKNIIKTYKGITNKRVVFDQTFGSLVVFIKFIQNIFQ